MPQYLYRLRTACSILVRCCAAWGDAELTGWSLLLTVTFGLSAALLQRSTSWAGHAVARVYGRSSATPGMLVQLYLVYFVLAPILDMDRFAAAVLALAIFEGASRRKSSAPVSRPSRAASGSRASTGLSPYAVYRCVILPQAVRLMLPPLTGLAVSLIKHSALVSVIAVADPDHRVVVT